MPDRRKIATAKSPAAKKGKAAVETAPAVMKAALQSPLQSPLPSATGTAKAPDKKPVKKAAGSLASAIAAFDIKSPELAGVIDSAALGSGGFPYPSRYKRKKYEKKIVPLQIELLKMLAWARANGERIVVLFEGRDGAGKGGAITRFTQHLPPRMAHVIALPKASDVEKGQWYFQRYAALLPSQGQIAFFDRSWYNRAGVERAMDFCTPEQTEEFLREAPAFEGMLVRDGIRLVKLFFSIGREMQMKRLQARYHDPLKQWKLSPIDFEAIPRFDAYSQAFNTMLARTHTERAPWTVIRANDKLRARLNAIRHVLSVVPYDGKDMEAIGTVDPLIVVDAADYLDAGGEK
jgi:polyphosphate kinase